MALKETLLFDVGGVLSPGTAVDVQHRLAQELGVPSDRIDVVWSRHHRALSTGAEAPAALARELARIADVTSADVLDAWETGGASVFVPREDLVARARRLPPAHRVGILSNTNALHARINRLSGLYAGFTPVFLSNELGRAKPDLEVYGWATHVLNLPPHMCVLVDDRLRNIEAATAFGMRGIEFDTMAKLQEDLAELGIEL